MKNNFEDTFSDILAEFKKRTGKNNTDIANDLGINKSTLSRYEWGKQEPGLNNLVTIAKYFGVSVETLLGVRGKSTGDCKPGWDSKLREGRRHIRVESDLRGLVDLMGNEKVFTLAELLQLYSAAVTAETLAAVADKANPEDRDIFDKYNDTQVTAIGEILEDDKALVFECHHLNLRLASPKSPEDKLLQIIRLVPVSKQIEEIAVDLFRQLLGDIRERYTLQEKALELTGS